MVHSILVVEDDTDLRSLLNDVLLDNGYSSTPVADGVEAIKAVTKSRPDLVVLDLGLPTMTGDTVCREIKKMYPDLPVIILTAKGTTSDIVHGLNIGADDYMAKPFEIDELLARIHARLRSQSAEGQKFIVADLELDTRSFDVTRAGKKIKLTPQEFKLLEYLMHNKGRIVTREMILNRVWLYSFDIDTRVVDVYVGYLRKKIDSGHKKKLLHSVRGFGYIMKD